MTWSVILMSKMTMISQDTVDLSSWLKQIESDSGEYGIQVIDELGDITKKEAERELKAIERKGKMYDNRTVHMYQDVIKTNQKKGLVAIVKGDKETGKLWHIVDQGTYRSKAHHFIDRVLNSVEPRVESILNRKGAKLGD
jgi:HK97 gp10 family phage protein